MSFICPLFCLIPHPPVHSKALQRFIFCLLLTPTLFVLVLLYHSCYLALFFCPLCSSVSQFPGSFFPLLNQFSLLLSPPCASPSAASRQPHRQDTIPQSNLIFSVLPGLHLQQPRENIKPVMSERPKDSC